MHKKENNEVRVALLISGGGTTAEAIIQAIQNGELTGIVPAIVISSRPDAGGIEKAKRLGVNVLVLDRTQLPDGDSFGTELLAVLKREVVDLVSQNGWLPLTPEVVIQEYKGRIINQHPGSLDPGRADFGGKGMFGARVTCARLAYAWLTDSDYWTESTVHHVSEEYDNGTIINTTSIPLPLPSRRIRRADVENDPQELMEVTRQVQRVLLPLEHKNVISVLDAFVRGTLPSVVRERPLIPSEHEHVVTDVKKLAARLFPGG